VTTKPETRRLQLPTRTLKTSREPLAFEDRIGAILPHKQVLSMVKKRHHYLRVILSTGSVKGIPGARVPLVHLVNELLCECDILLELISPHFLEHEVIVPLVYSPVDLALSCI
jgi:hypothetical protein